MKVYIDASSDIQYASYYIYGLYEVFGKQNVRFSSRYFKSFKHDNHFFAFVITKGTSQKKVIVDFTDDSSIDSTALQWADVYGKINLEISKTPHNKIVSIGPSFGIRIYSLVETIWFAFSNLLKSYSRIPNKRKFLSNYKAQFKRPKLSDYSLKPPKKNYIFFMASLWKKESETNKFRANFIKSCKANTNIEFEGGFAPRTKKDIEGFEDLTTEARIDMMTYLENIKASLLVFNTPAVASCHGWKLAEYLCLGKAIISTPLTRQLPKQLESGLDVIYTTGTIEDLTETVNKIFTQPLLRQELELRAYAYYNMFLAPKKVIELLSEI